MTAEASASATTEATEATITEAVTTEAAEAAISVKMNTFRPTDRKASLFTRAIDRLSFRCYTFILLLLLFFTFSCSFTFLSSFTFSFFF